MRKAIAGTGLVTLTLLATVWITQGADRAVPKGASEDFLPSKYLEVIGKDNRIGAYLENARFREVHGNKYIVGELVEGSDRWKGLGGKTAWIAWDNVAVIYKLDDLEPHAAGPTISD
jgi:hypothetical protein